MVDPLPEGLLPVEQVDREEEARRFEQTWPYRDEADRLAGQCRSGLMDTSLGVQSFTRHRLQAIASVSQQPAPAASVWDRAALYGQGYEAGLATGLRSTPPPPPGEYAELVEQLQKMEAIYPLGGWIGSRDAEILGEAAAAIITLTRVP